MTVQSKVRKGNPASIGSGRSIVVLKFGGSVLRSDACTQRVLHAIYAHLREGKKIIAVVSAYETDTDALEARARFISDDPEPEAYASLLATGEALSSSVLALAADAAGIETKLLDYRTLGIRTVGNAADSHPTSVDFSDWDTLFDRVSLVVVPGFIGLNSDAAPVLLGRGGSDLTALFLANAVGASACALYKDVGGWFVDDPKSNARADQFLTLSWEDALKDPVDIVQHKALAYARSVDMPFVITGLNSTCTTSVGSDLTVSIPAKPYSEPIPVVVAGAGSVGRGVIDYLRALDQKFVVTKVLVRDVTKHADLDQQLLTTRPQDLLLGEKSILIECTGDLDVGNYLASSALLQGCHVVTAGKELVARHGSRLEALALAKGIKFQYSAAVGGAVPILEVLASTQDVVRISGVVNGTANYVVNKLREGVPLEDAVREAQDSGFAEADPSNDLEGTDAAYKSILLAHRVGGRWLKVEDVDVEPADLSLLSATNRIRQVATVYKETNELQWKANVKYQILDTTNPLYDVQGCRNRIVIETANGEHQVIGGKGAGRYPTALAIIGDVLSILDESVKRNAVKAQEAA